MSAAREAAEPTAVDVCAWEELAEGEITEVAVGSLSACAVRLGNEAFVFGARCPHHGGPLGRGRIMYPVTSRCPGSIDVDHDRPTVACPWHGWEFLLESGQTLTGAPQRMRVFDASVVDGRVVVSRPARVS